MNRLKYDDIYQEVRQAYIAGWADSHPNEPLYDAVCNQAVAYAEKRYFALLQGKEIA